MFEYIHRMISIVLQQRPYIRADELRILQIEDYNITWINKYDKIGRVGVEDVWEGFPPKSAREAKDGRLPGYYVTGWGGNWRTVM
jgi:hypothetical protein